MTDNKQTAIFDPITNMVIDVDEGIAPLLKAIWKCCIITCNSCQENQPGIVWIEFPAAEGARGVLDSRIWS